MHSRDPHSYTDVGQGTVAHLDLDLKIDFKARRLRGVAALTLKSAAPGPLFLDTRGLEIEKIVSGGDHSLEWELHEPESFMGSKLEVRLPKGESAIKIYYQTGADASALQWLEPQQTAGGEHPYLFSQCQPIHARSMVPIQDSPRVRFSYRASITVPEPLVAVMSAAPGEGKADKGAGTITYQFDMPQAIPAYLLALAVGQLESRDLGPRSRVYAEPATIDAAAYEFAEVDAMITAAEAIFGPYRWDRFDFLVMPPSFPYGGMENPRLTFLTPTLLAGDRSLVNVLAHELAHSWTGNLVTNATMNDFWLNEGFTVWAERRILEKLGGRDALSLAAAIGRNGLNQEMERFQQSPELTRLETDLSGLDPDEVYSLVPYEKGFLFVAALEKAVGREAFDQFILDYIDQFSFTSLSTGQFEAFLRERLPQVAETMDIEQWIHQPGIPDDAPVFSSGVLDRVQSLAANWSAGDRPDVAEMKKWHAELWQIFLQGIPSTLSNEECRWFDDNFDLVNSENAEILSSWLVIAAASEHRAAFDRIDRFLGTVGRMKFLKPLFVTLHKGEQTRDLAAGLFAKYAASYHPIAKAVIERVLTP